MFEWIEGALARRCPVCSTVGEQDLVLSHDSVVGDAVLVSRCRECGSLATGRDPLEMTDTAAAIDSYVEATAGIGTIGERLYLLPVDSVRSLLDVGCGYGFGVDIGQFLFGWRCVGVEPTQAGLRGADELGLDIRASYLTDVVVDGAPFDAVLASEVLEHVTDPMMLLAAMRAQLAPNGTVVLTTPAAESVDPRSSVQTVTEVLSVPYHHFVASTSGLERLLRASGFAAVAVRRHGSVLVAIARVEPGELTLPAPQSVPPAQMEAYLLDRAGRSEPGSALQLGCVVRALRSMVARGAFDEAVATEVMVADAFDRRTGRSLGDPLAVSAAIREGWMPTLALPGAAFASGMIEMLHRRDPSAAQRWFTLAELSASTLRTAGQLVDLDSLDLVVQAAGHGALCAAMSNGGGVLAAAAVNRIAAATDRESAEWWRCRVFVEAVSAGHYDDAELLLAGVASVAHSMALSTLEAHRRTGLDTLFTWGILCLVREKPREALGLFLACANGCTGADSSGHSQQLLAEATRHVEVARKALGIDGQVVQRQRSSDDGEVRATIEGYWCDAYGMNLAGWMTASGRRWVQLGIRVGDVVRWGSPQSRPDVKALIPGAVDDALGFNMYVASAPHPRISVMGRTDQGEVIETEIALPAHPLPVIEVTESSLDQVEAIRRAPSGPVLLIGARAAEESTRIDDEIRAATGREVICVDIHAGLGVDVVADAHALTDVFLPGAFAVTVSSMVLEHLAVPWLVARECAAVTMSGGLAIHIGPFMWPAHAQPNDYWRFSPAALEMLFGPATGFEVVESGAEWPTIAVPGPTWRNDFRSMPTTATLAQSWVVSRRLNTPIPAVTWAYDRIAAAEQAQAYPVSGLAQRKQP